MIPKYRSQFNGEFTEEKYLKVQSEIEDEVNKKIEFRLSESPIFITNDLQKKIFDASNSIINQVGAISPDELNRAIPRSSKVPGDDSHYHFLAIDFGICKNEAGEVEPQLIELQAFPSLFSYQCEYETVLRTVYPLLDGFKRRIPKDDYIEQLREIILGKENPENVILLELFPEKQKTNIDFYITEKYLGIKTVCLTKLIKEGDKLYYENDGRKIPVHRIYNRVIFDELEQYGELNSHFQLTDDVDVTWITHPNWFFKISKFILPMLKHAYVPESFFLNEAPADLDLKNYVLKPLFSFAGSGIDLHPTKETLDKISDKSNYILQKKVVYAPLFEDINGDFSKAEVRLLFARSDDSKELKLLTNLVRMTKADMVNVDFNKKDAIWIGSSIAFFEGDLK